MGTDGLLYILQKLPMAEDLGRIIEKKWFTAITSVNRALRDPRTMWKAYNPAEFMTCRVGVRPQLPAPEPAHDPAAGHTLDPSHGPESSHPPRGPNAPEPLHTPGPPSAPHPLNSPEPLPVQTSLYTGGVTTPNPPPDGAQQSLKCRLCHWCCRGGSGVNEYENKEGQSRG